MNENKSIGSAIWRMNAILNSVNDELMENGGELTPELEQKLISTEMSSVDIADGLQALIARAKEEDVYLGDEIKRLQSLKRSRANAIDSLKRFLLNTMEAQHIDSIEGHYCKVTVGNGVESVDADEVGLLTFAESRARKQLASLQEALPSYVLVDLKLSKSILKDYLTTDGAVIPTSGEGDEERVLAKIVRNKSLRIK